jgi:hypothetical protein
MALDADLIPCNKGGGEVKSGAIMFMIQTNGAISPGEVFQHVTRLLKPEPFQIIY